MLTGCSKEDPLIKQATALRQSILASNGCSFRAEITVDYGEEIYEFQMDCIVDSSGQLQFTVREPETIAGITGYISQEQADITFDDKILAFPILADDQLTPVSAPWVFVQTLRGGYLSGCSKDDSGICLYIDDSYEEHPLQLEIQMSSDWIPQSVEIIWNNRRVLSMIISDFRIE